MIQAEKEDALGNSGMGLGFDGIQNSLAIEFDTYFNYEILDPFKNHISVHATLGRGGRPNSSNHSHSLGHTNSVQLLTEGKLTARIRYVPRCFDPAHLSSPSFAATPHLLSLLLQDDEDDTTINNTAATRNNNSPAVSDGIASATARTSNHHPGGTPPPPGPPPPAGLLSVYIQDLHHRPVLTVPLHLAAVLKLNRGRAWVGFTASTGQEIFQAHDIHSWQFQSLRTVDPPQSC